MVQGNFFWSGMWQNEFINLGNEEVTKDVKKSRFGIKGGKGCRFLQFVKGRVAKCR